MVSAAAMGAGLGSVPAELQCCALVLHGLGDIVFGKHFSVLFGGIAQYEYGLGYAALAKLYGLGQAGYREEVCALLFQEKAAVYRSVAVCVGLYDAEHLLAGALGYFKVVLQCRHVYFRPGAGLRVNIAHVEPPCIFCYRCVIALSIFCTNFRTIPGFLQQKKAQS